MPEFTMTFAVGSPKGNEGYLLLLNSQPRIMQF